MRVNDSDRVIILNENSTAEIVVELPEKCVCEGSPRSSSAISDGATAAIVVSVVVVLAIVTALVVCLMYLRRRAKNSQ